MLLTDLPRRVQDGVSSSRNPSPSQTATDGYRGVYHRARIRATRWLHPSDYVIPRAAEGERGIRQRRYWARTIRDENDFTRPIDYVHAAGIELSPWQNKLDNSTRSCFTTTIDRA
jgi:hypothetical protein